MPNFRTVASYVLALLVGGFLLLPVNVSAQAMWSKLTGQVTDPSGAAVPHASVTAVKNDTQQTYTTTTSSAGVYAFPYVLPGLYTVTAAASGFKTHTQDKVLLTASQTYGLNFSLVVGSITQKVTVTSIPPLIQTAGGSGGTIIPKQLTANLPLNGRQVFMLIGTTPGSQFTQTQFGSSGFSGTRGWDVTNEYSVGGGANVAGNWNNFTLNGSNDTVMTGFGEQGTWMTAPNEDAIQEVDVKSDLYDARYGTTGGGVVTMVTKSGTNAFHGDAYDYLENGALNANVFQNNANGVPVEDTNQNQWGGTVGGPIKKNKIFFFMSYEGYKETIPFSVLTSVPTAAERSGDFSQTEYTVYNPATTACLAPAGTLLSCTGDNYGRTEFPGDTIPAADINKSGAALDNLFPMPNINVTSDVNNFTSSANDHYRYDQYMPRLDYSTSQNTRFYSAFEWQGGREVRNTSGFTGAAENGNINHTRNNIIATQDMTHVFSPTLVGDFKASFSRFGEFEENGLFSAQTGAKSLGLTYPVAGPAGNPDLDPQITFSELYPELVGNQLTDSIYTNDVFDADFTKMAGRNSIEFGGEYGEYQFANAPGGSPNGDFEFETSATQYNPLQRDELTGITDGNVIASMLLGDPQGGGVDWNTSTMEGFPMWDIYGQDDIRVTRKLNFTIGLRYDVEDGVRERYDRLNRGLCLSCINPVTNNPTYQANLAADTPALTAYGFTGTEVNALKTLYGGIEFPGVNGQPTDAYNTDYNDIGPRVGFAYALNNKTVIRGGWGWIYAYGIEGGTTDGYSIATPYIGSLNGNVTPTNYFQTGSPFPSGLDVPAGSSQGLLTDIGNQANIDFPGRRIPRVQEMSLGVQRALPGHILLDVKYSGNYSRNLRDHQWISGTFNDNGGPMEGSICGLTGNVGYPQLQEHTYNSCVGSWYNSNVPNPFYGVLPLTTAIGSSPEIGAADLLQAFPEFDLVGDYTVPLGRAWYDSLQVQLMKRLYGATRGLVFNAAYTFSKNTQSDGWNNGWPWQDEAQQYQLTGDDRPQVFTFSASWDLPMGAGAKYVLTHPSKPLGYLVNGWNLSWIFSAESGTPVGIGGGDWPISSYSLYPSGGPTFEQWLNNCNGVPSNCFVSRGAFSQGIPGWAGQAVNLRNPTIPDLDITVEKNFRVTESKHFQLRMDMFNTFNTPLFPGPDTNYNDGPPVKGSNGAWSGYGTINFFQQNFARVIQIALKFYF